MLTDAYHWRDGLFFGLTEDRSVHIFRMAPHDAEPTTVALIPREEWSSILGALARTVSGKAAA